MSASDWQPPTPERHEEILTQARALAAEQRATNNRLADILVGLWIEKPSLDDFAAALDEMDMGASEVVETLEASDRSSDPEVRALILRLRNRAQP